jgi:hypothetical protein
MSEIEDGTGFPSNARLEQALRDAVRAIHETKNLENLTVKRIRKAAEEKLGLEENFFKGSSTWKERSQNIITNEVVSSVLTRPYKTSSNILRIYWRLQKARLLANPNPCKLLPNLNANPRQ